MLPVTLIRAGSHPRAADIPDALAREAFRVDVAGLTLPAAPATALVLVFVDAAVDAGTFERLVRWRARAPFACGLVGCAPEGGVGDSERALAAGFDDFVAGRLSVRELAGRLRAVARRLAPRPESAGRLSLGRLVLDAAGHEIWVDGRRVHLTRLESRTLGALIRAPGHTLSRAELLDRVWGEGATETSPRAVDNVMQRLRRKIGAGETIITVRGLGFRLASG